MAKVELFGSSSCPYTQEMREFLELRGREFVEHDIEADPGARARLLHLAKGQRMIPVLVEDDEVVQVGWQGRGCGIGGF